VTATLHFALREPASVEAFLFDASGRFFLPVMEATVTSHYWPDWSFEAPLALVNRAAVEYCSLLE
jgi:hypothetical protein